MLVLVKNKIINHIRHPAYNSEHDTGNACKNNEPEHNMDSKDDSYLISIEPH